LLLVSAGCQVEGCEVTDPPLPGESLVHSINELDGFSVSSAGETIFWAATGEGRARFVYEVALSEAPVNNRSLYILGHKTEGPLVAHGDGVVVALDTEIRRLAEGGTDTLVVAEDVVEHLAVDVNRPEPLLVWISGSGLFWRPLESQEAPQSAALSGGSPLSLATTRDYLFVGTYGGVLWRVSRDTGAAVEIARADDFAGEFPPFNDICPGPAVQHRSGHLIAEEGIHDRVLWSILQTSRFAGCDRGLIIDIPASPNEAAQVIVDQQWNPRTFVSDGTTVYWVEHNTRPSDHMPGTGGYETLWMAPREGGDPVFAVENFRDVVVSSGFLYGNSADISPFDAIRRLPLPLEPGEIADPAAGAR
jgi:hypothetical protein